MALTHRAQKLRKRYGLSLKDYDRMVFIQGGRCAICQRPPPVGKRLEVDHCHTTGVLRGLLCGFCNRALGLFRDNPGSIERAMRYINLNTDEE